MRNAILGSWELSLVESRLEDGSVDHPFGTVVRGLLVYTPEGWMTAQLALGDRAPFAVNDMWKGTSEEVRAAFNGYLAYYGRYELNEQEGIIVHHVAESLFPNWRGDVQRRRIAVDGDHLVLSTLPMQVGGRIRTSVLTWKRSHRAP